MDSSSDETDQIDVNLTHPNNETPPPINVKSSPVKNNANVSFQNKSKTTLYLSWLLPIIGLPIAIGFFYFPLNSTSTSVHHPNCTFDNLKIKYPQGMLWASLNFSIDEVLNKIPTKPSIFLIAHSKQDRNEADDLINRIVDITSKCMQTNGKPLKLNYENFSTNEILKDYGVAINTYKPLLDASGVLWVKDLNKVFFILFFILSAVVSVELL